ncbi:MAG: hypothetical protein AAF399_14900 [Bacteroidota bacterium]
MFRSAAIACCLLPLSLLAQSFPHDACERALPIAVGQSIPLQNNREAGIQERILPAVQPITCIKTYENDLWYRFEADSQFRFYEILIEPLACETPAGVQAMIIRSDDCEPSHFEYVACQNPYAVESLSLWVEDALPGSKYLLQVDGYDGNLCEFQVHLRGFVNDPREAADFQQQQMDYSQPAESFEPATWEGQSLNNETILRWQVGSQDGVSLFLVQAVVIQGATSIGETLGSVEPVATVGQEQIYTYRFRDGRMLAPGQTYCYRLVQIGPGSRRAYSDPICVEAKRNEDFFVTPVVRYDSVGVYSVQFTNERKQDLVFRLLDVEGKELKSLVRAKEPKGNGLITIDMEPYPTGSYQLRIEGKREFFLRSFVKE